MSSHTNQTYPRRLTLEGAPNVRDLGGYKTADGRVTRWAKLLRAGRLSNLSSSDQNQLSKLNLQTVCDFRHHDECLRDATQLGDNSTATIHNLAINAGNQNNTVGKTDISLISPQQMALLMVEINRDLALQHTHTFRAMFRLLLNTEQGSFLFHCSAGKDRTGFAAALILAALGVPRDTIMEDYLLTAQYYPPEGEIDYLVKKYANDKSDVDINIFKTLTSCREEFLNAAFSAIESQYQSIDHYLESAIGLSHGDLETLKTRDLC
jgi:protein-tyrosine phosphatase